MAAPYANSISVLGIFSGHADENALPIVHSNPGMGFTANAIALLDPATYNWRCGQHRDFE